MNAYVANIISKGYPLAIGKALYFQLLKPKFGFVNGKMVQVGESMQRVKAREVSS